MPRPQRIRRQRPRSAALRPCTKPTARRRRDSGTSLTDDALAGIFARLPDTADVVRCAATCARWGRVVSTSGAAISRSLPHSFGRFLPQLAVGVVFHLRNTRPTTRTRSQPDALRPRFLATASGRRLLGRQRSAASFFELDGIAVASRNGRLVLELRRPDSLAFRVCSPMTGDAVVLPPLSGEDTPADYGCALLTGDDLRPRRCSKSFRLLLVYNNRRHGFTALRCYSSDTGRWGAEARSPVSVSTRELRRITGSAAVLRGLAFWPLDHGALGVRVDNAGDLSDVHLLPYDCPFDWLKDRLLGVSPDSRLFFIYLGLRAGDCTFTPSISYFDIHGHGDDDFQFQNGRKQSSSVEEKILIHQMKMDYTDIPTFKLRWIGEKSGMVLFTVGERGRHGGAHLLNLREGTVEKLTADSWGNAVGFEMDCAAYLSSVTSTTD